MLELSTSESGTYRIAFRHINDGHLHAMCECRVTKAPDQAPTQEAEIDVEAPSKPYKPPVWRGKVYARAGLSRAKMRTLALVAALQNERPGQPKFERPVRREIWIAYHAAAVAGYLKAISKIFEDAGIKVVEEIGIPPEPEPMSSTSGAVRWRCDCGTENVDTRRRFVMCGGCGRTYDDAPVEGNNVRGTHQSQAQAKG